MKKGLLWVALVALLCSCAKEENVTLDQPETKSLQNITLNIEYIAGGGNGSPYSMQFACEEMPLYGINFIYFDLVNPYIDYDGTGWNPQWIPSINVTIDYRYSEIMPIMNHPDMYVDEDSFRTQPDLSSTYNITYNVIGMPCH